MSRPLVLGLITAALVLTTCAGNTPPSAASADSSTTAPSKMNAPADSLMLFDFDDSDAAQWNIENDGVMGGRSQGAARIADGTLVFTGEVVTEGGGFSSVRASLREDLSGYDGIALRVRGGGRTFELDVDDGTRSRGREVNRRGPFPTSRSWETVRVPFNSLAESAHGEPVRVAPIDLSAVASIGIYIIDGKDGPFRLEVDWIRAYRAAE